ncbi:hypothetical protein L208DRAFT_1327085 [Tricholoma matsutake]|nr:hypothetical protein L208DRAFT_1327085 [Tricholoma matsutake 945]
MAYGSATFQISPPTGLIWSNNSCAYDSVFTILYSLWRNNPTHWKQFFYSMNCDLLEEICNGFNDHSYNQTSLESVRDTFRMGLDDLRLAGLCWGRYTSVVRLLKYMFKAFTEMVSSQLTCREGHSITHSQCHSIYSYILSAGTNPYVSTTDWIQNYKEDSCLLCQECNQCLQCTYSFLRIPDLIVFEFEGKEIFIDPEVTITSRDNQSCTMKLQGVIYYGELHYTSHVMINEQIWFHDGISTGAKLPTWNMMDD